MFLQTVFILSFVLQTVVLQTIFTCTLYFCKLYSSCTFYSCKLYSSCVLCTCKLYSNLPFLFLVLCRPIWFYCSSAKPKSKRLYYSEGPPWGIVFQWCEFEIQCLLLCSSHALYAFLLTSCILTDQLEPMGRHSPFCDSWLEGICCCHL